MRKFIYFACLSNDESDRFCSDSMSLMCCAERKKEDDDGGGIANGE